MVVFCQLIANFFFGLGSMLIFHYQHDYAHGTHAQQALLGLTCNNFVRYIFACIGGVIAEPLIAAIGNGWLFTGLGAPAAFSSIVVWAIAYYGPRWRGNVDVRLK